MSLSDSSRNQTLITESTDGNRDQLVNHSNPGSINMKRVYKKSV